METQEDMILNKYGQSIVSSNELCELLLQNKNINYLNIIPDQDIELYKEFQDTLLDNKTILLDIPDEVQSLDDFYVERSNEWIFPLEFQTVDVLQFLLDKCKTDTEMDRVRMEYKLFEERDLIMILRLFIYMVSYFRENKIVWGVGRGSSVASYCLYLIGIHRIDSIKYNLSITEFLR